MTFESCSSQNSVIISLLVQYFSNIILTLTESFMITITGFSELFILIDKGLSDMSLSHAICSFLVSNVSDIWHHLQSWESLVESLDYIVILAYVFPIDSL